MISHIIRASNNCSVKCNVSKHIGPREENPIEETGEVRENLSSHSIVQAIWNGCLSAKNSSHTLWCIGQVTSHQLLKTQDDKWGSTRAYIESPICAYSSLVLSSRLDPVSSVTHAWWMRQLLLRYPASVYSIIRVIGLDMNSHQTQALVHQLAEEGVIERRRAGRIFVNNPTVVDVLDSCYPMGRHHIRKSEN